MGVITTSFLEELDRAVSGYALAKSRTPYSGPVSEGMRKYIDWRQKQREIDFTERDLKALYDEFFSEIIDIRCYSATEAQNRQIYEETGLDIPQTYIDWTDILKAAPAILDTYIAFEGNALSGLVDSLPEEEKVFFQKEGYLHMIDVNNMDAITFLLQELRYLRERPRVFAKLGI